MKKIIRACGLCRRPKYLMLRMVEPLRLGNIFLPTTSSVFFYSDFHNKNPLGAKHIKVISLIKTQHRKSDWVPYHFFLFNSY